MDAVTLIGPDACLAFLILNQNKWHPDIRPNGKDASEWLPVRVVGVVR